ncbi:Pimeloyl-ACP methyl ester carboxylesterase [Parasphingorhabdus marina DSM 22363]|uniref:Pimeloyl-ACP methyl ester carboxylesterase n=1 Tax=Parasphingorhabdus marina DSM 22363 TaxID=1123272 RepID=A0A1N6ENC4_9SPHN|nr:alpha/beta hydrolase [Parasphingorhabdus marina]SIN84441.1 Pimeloyl-ACP methyl ester carboxylesterase [Parasphingorhabdus marina DSM 22363]
MKLLVRLALGLAILLVGAFFLFRTPDADKAEMIAKYGSEASRFAPDGAGGEIHYRDEGNRDGPVILLIHGSNSHLQTWEEIVRLLGDRFRLISLDLPGHGLTGPSSNGDYSADGNIASVVKILDVTGVDKAYWIGNSMGGWVSWRAGLAVPDRVSGLVLIDSSGAQTGEKIKPYLGARLAQSTIGQWLLPQITPKFLVRSSLEENYAQPERLTDEIVTRYHDMLHFPGNRYATLERGKTPRQPEMWNQVGSLDMPVLLLWGAQDRVIPVSHGEAFRKAIPGCRLIVYDDAGHLPMEETPEQVARDIRIWIDEVEASTESATTEAEAG